MREGASISTDPSEPLAGPTDGTTDPVDVLGAGDAVRGVLRIGDFRRVWYATALSSLGDWLGLLATTALAASLATSYEGENYALGLVLVVRLLPSVVLGPLAGAFADRFDRRRTMVISDLLRFVLFMAIPLSIKLDIGNDRKLLVLYVASFLVECVSLFWNPAKDASVPNLVGREHVEAANQLGLITTYGLTPVAAAGLFSGLALLTDRVGMSGSLNHPDQVLLSLYFNAATFVVAAAVIYTVHSISGPAARGAARRDAEQPGLFAMLGEGATFMSSSKLLRGVIVGILGAFAAGGGVIGAGHTYVTSLGGGNAAYGVLFGAVFVGLGLGMAVAPKIAQRLPRRLVFGLAIVLAGVCLVLTSLAPHVFIALIVIVGVGFGGGVAFLSGLTLLGTEISDDMRGRVFAFIQSLVRVVLILSLAAVPFIVGWVGQPSLGFIGAHVVIDGTRIVLAVGGLLAMLAGYSSYRLMGERRPVRFSRRGGAEATNGPGLLIAFEGGEGSGKSTQIDALAVSLRGDGVDVDVTFEPGATPAGSRIRAIVLESKDDLDDRAEALLFAADRANHVATMIRPALADGRVVLTDRYIDSSLAYQGAGRSLSVEEVRRLSKWATGDLVPDLTIVLDIPVADGLARAARRSAADRLEQESTAFHQRVRDAFRSYADKAPERYLVVDARLPRDEVSARVRAAVDEVLDSAGIAHGPGAMSGPGAELGSAHESTR